jgi:hypothetical protein
LAECRLVDHRGGWRQLASCSEIREKLLDCRRIATVHASKTLATFDKGGDQLVVQLVKVTATTNQPLIELPEQLQL